MTNRLLEAWIGFGILILALIGFFWFVPTFVEESDFAEIPPSLLPNTAIVIIGALGGIMFLHRMFLQNETNEPPVITLGNLGQITGITAIFGAAIFLFSYAGYLFGGAFLVAALMLNMGERRWPRIVVVSVVAPLFLYGLFQVGLGIPLP